MNNSAVGSLPITAWNNTTNARHWTATPSLRSEEGATAQGQLHLIKLFFLYLWVRTFTEAREQKSTPATYKWLINEMETGYAQATIWSAAALPFLPSRVLDGQTQCTAQAVAISKTHCPITRNTAGTDFATLPPPHLSRAQLTKTAAVQVYTSLLFLCLIIEEEMLRTNKHYSTHLMSQMLHRHIRWLCRVSEHSHLESKTLLLSIKKSNLICNKPLTSLI